MGPEPTAPADPLDELATAIHANDAPRAAQVIARHPDLRPRLNDALPGGHFGATALLRAVELANREMVDALLRGGADINARSHWWAGSFGVLDSETDLTGFLIERGAIVDAHAAARLGMMERLDELISRDPSLVHARGGDGQTPLHFAKTVEVARYLLDQGADIDALDMDHESTPAQWMLRERPEVARFLVVRGCRTDIILAAVLGSRPLVERHLAADPTCINTTVSERWFPKEDARAGGCIYFYTLGVNSTPHALAREFGHEEIYRLLMERSPDELKLSLACEVGDEETFRDILTRRPDVVRWLSDNAKRRLTSVAQSNNTPAVQFMLTAGWPADVRGDQGETALHWAAFHGNARMVREILSHQPPIDVQDGTYDKPPLGWALHGSLHGWHRDKGDYPAVVEALLGAGAVAPSTDQVNASPAVLEVLRRFERTESS
jgi:ankyrin repeat protein